MSKAKKIDALATRIVELTNNSVSYEDAKERAGDYYSGWVPLFFRNHMTVNDLARIMARGLLPEQ